MSWTEILDIAQSVAVAVAAVAAIYGVTSWRREIRARRCAELAERTLALFYEAHDLIAAARFPGSSSNEGLSRKQLGDEDDDEKRIKNAWYVPVERLNHQAEFWGRFEAARYPFMAVFGKEADTHFQSVKKARNKVITSAGMLLRTYDGINAKSEENQRNRTRWENNIGWGLTAEDELAGKIECAVSAIEEICRPAIDGSKAA